MPRPIASATDATLTQLEAELATLDGAAPDGEARFIPGFWSARGRADFPPPAVSDPAAWDGSAHLHVRLVPAGATAREQKQLLARWIEALPTLRGVTMLWIGGTVPQALFDAACALPGLVGMHLVTNRVRDLSALRDATSLRYLDLGASSYVESLEPLRALTALEWLQVESPVKAFDVAPLGDLRALRGLGFVGAEAKKWTVPSLSPLAELTGLHWLHLGGVHVADGSIRPLGALRALEWLGLANVFAMEEFAWLSTRLPTTHCDWLQPYCRFHRSVFPCAKCRRNARVMTSGKGARLLCPSCDTRALARHVHAFRQAEADAARTA